MSPSGVDVAVVGAGPNGLAAAITLAREGHRVRLHESRDTVGGGVRTHEPFGPGVLVDHCATVMPLARSSPFFRDLELRSHGLEWIEPEVQIAHPLDDGSAVLVSRDIASTTDSFGSRTDAQRYAGWMRPTVARWDRVIETLVGPLRPRAVLADPLVAMLFGPPALLPASWLVRSLRSPRTRALIAGCAAHSSLPLESPLTSSVGLSMLASAHADGWPMVRGGSSRLSEALAAILRDLGGEIRTGHHVRSLGELRDSEVQLLDLAPRAVLSVAGDRLGGRYARRLRGFRYGPGAFKVDYLLERPIPWKAPGVAAAGTVHLGGTVEEIAASERTVAAGSVHERPFIILAQPTQLDPSRAPAGRHVVWAYCHVPNGWPDDVSDRLTRQVERFAPGFRDTILERHITTPADLERDDANLVGGDIGGGSMDWRQFFTRPVLRRDPYSTPDPALFICSASTPPGGGVHGLCGMYAARAAVHALGQR